MHLDQHIKGRNLTKDNGTILNLANVCHKYLSTLTGKVIKLQLYLFNYSPFYKIKLRYINEVNYTVL